MKKILTAIALAMVAVFALCFVGCGDSANSASSAASSSSISINSSSSGEHSLANENDTVDLNASTLLIEADIDVDETRAKQKWNGKRATLRKAIFVARRGDYADFADEITSSGVGKRSFHVYMPIDEIDKLEKGEECTLAGTLEVSRGGISLKDAALI